MVLYTLGAAMFSGLVDFIRTATSRLDGDCIVSTWLHVNCIKLRIKSLSEFDLKWLTSRKKPLNYGVACFAVKIMWYRTADAE